MGLLSAMNASVSGMNAQANLLATVSENISNSNTTGYKQASTLFRDIVDQFGNTGDYTAGGVTTLVRYKVSEQGGLTGTSSATDIAIQGNGFFLVEDSNGATFLTRAGSFVEDASGNLVNAAGYTLMGYSLAPGAGGITGSLAGLQPVNINGTALIASPSTAGSFTANLNSNAATLTGAPSTTNYTSKSSMIAYDNLGNQVTLDIYFSKTGTNAWQVDVYDNAAPATPLTTQTLSFDPANGKLTTVSPQALSIAVPGGNTVSLDIANMTQLASAFAVTSATMDGNAPSQVQSVNISTDGTLYYVYANGKEVPAYNIPLGNVISPDNLTNLSGDVFQVNAASGGLVIGTAGNGGLGLVRSSQLENSTVDLATQLTDMIVAQRGYESNTKVFQTGSELLAQLNNMLK
ncbi:MAG: flagellar hook protein FlgE [Beijerinckiaceae bacterium]|nr:flagellar hook protein FlgE [Beijerinckiaceae bacterium]